MSKLKTFKSSVLMRRINKFQEAAEAHAFKGAVSESHEHVEQLENDLRKARLALVNYVMEFI